VSIEVFLDDRRYALTGDQGLWCGRCMLLLRGRSYLTWAARERVPRQNFTSLVPGRWGR